MGTYDVNAWIILTICLNYASVCQTLDDASLLERIVKEKHLNEEFELSELSSIRAIFPPHPDGQGRTRGKRSTRLDDSPFELTFSAFNNTFRMAVKYNPNLLPAYTPVLMRSNNTVSRYIGKKPDCFLEGRTQGEGLVALTFCDGYEGSILEGDFMYRIDPAGEMSPDMEETVVVSRGHFKHPFNDLIRQVNDLPVNKTRSKRAVPGTAFTVEVGIFVDEGHVTKLETDGATTTELKIRQIAALWNGAQAAIALSDDLGYNITLQIKQIEFWTTNPVWYEIHESSGSTTLSNFCDGIKTHANVLPSDHLHLHTMLLDSGGAHGYSKIPGVCTGSPCAVTKVDWTSYYLVSHELGHSLGMRHDADVGCGSTLGIMDAFATGSYSWSSCSRSALDTFVQSADPACLFAENVDPTLVDARIAAITLEGVFEGMTTSPDEVCVHTHGSGYRYRGWYIPRDQDSICFFSNCVDMNDGANYGVIYPGYRHLRGTYCAEGSVCGEMSDCIPWADTRIPLDKFTVVPGGWGEWGAYTTTCSRTCGVGITYRERSCNNPSPLLAPFCEGPRTEATLCNTQPCTGDPTTDSELIKQRAGEVCADLIAKGIRDGSHDGTGKNRNSGVTGECEVGCNPSPGWGDRFALMPDGTPCTLNIPGGSVSDEKGFPRGSGMEARCARGYCETFSCDGTTSGVKRDGCGVCGGDNSTCQIVEGVFTDPVPSGSRYNMVTLPAGAYLIQFYFTWSTMAEHYIEIWDPATDSSIFVPIRQGIFDARETPVSAVGADWFYYWYDQYLYTNGPITANITIKIYNYQSNTNTGITYGYSLPLASTTSTSTTSSTSTSTSTSTTSPTPTSASTSITSTPTSTTFSTLTSTPTSYSSTSTTSTSTTQSTTSMNTPLVTPAPSTVTLSPATSTSSSPSDTSSSTSSLTTSSSVSASITSTTTPTRNCGWGFLECPTGLCIYYTQMCDGVDDCGDNTDETYIACRSGSSGLQSSMVASPVTLLCLVGISIIYFLLSI